MISQEAVEQINLMKWTEYISGKHPDIRLLFHVPNGRTRNIIDAEALSKMKERAILINVSRGGLIDPDALINALESHRIGAAGLDTHCVEPVPVDSRFDKLDNVVLRNL